VKKKGFLQKQDGVRASASTRRGACLWSHCIRIRCDCGEYVLWVEAHRRVSHCGQRTFVSPHADVFVSTTGRPCERTCRCRPQCDLPPSTLPFTYHNDGTRHLEIVSRSPGARVVARPRSAVDRRVLLRARVIKSRRRDQTCGPLPGGRAPPPSDTTSLDSQRSWPWSPTPA